MATASRVGSRACARCNLSFEPETKMVKVPEKGKPRSEWDEVSVICGSTMFCPACVAAMHKPDPYADATAKLRRMKAGKDVEGHLPEDVRIRWGLTR